MPNRQECYLSFNPRTPCGVRPAFGAPATVEDWFQSTHSLRSATPQSGKPKMTAGFQSTHSLRSATMSTFLPLLSPDVSIHALLAECDVSLWLELVADNVSIHALLAECDLPSITAPSISGSFNPRTPCGVRLAKSTRPLRMTAFQSTHSLRSATSTAPTESISPRFQSTHSLRSATGYQPPTRGGKQFQSTHSLRSATIFVQVY